MTVSDLTEEQKAEIAKVIEWVSGIMTMPTLAKVYTAAYTAGSEHLTVDQRQKRAGDAVMHFLAVIDKAGKKKGTE